MTMIGQHIGSYKIVRILGEGGMGEVFEAVHEKLHRRAAIKVLHPHVARAPEMAARFRNEARAVNIIRHPGVVDIYEHGQLPDGTVYLVMEYLEGRSLRETLDQEVLTEAQAILLSQQLASALAAAHGKGIIHRDLKPDVDAPEARGPKRRSAPRCRRAPPGRTARPGSIRAARKGRPDSLCDRSKQSSVGRLS